MLANLLSNAVKFTDKGEVGGARSGPAAHTAAARWCERKGERVPAAACERPWGGCAAQVVVRVTVERADEVPRPQLAGPRRSVGAAGEEAGGSGSVVHFAVRDTGIGIGEESARKLFQHFRQVRAL